MNPRKTHSGAARLEAVLLRQREALKHGHMDVLAEIAAKIEREMVGAMRSLPASEVERLRKLAGGNARLIKAALAGLADVRAMRQTIDQAELRTYDANGALVPSAQKAQTLTRG